MASSIALRRVFSAPTSFSKLNRARALAVAPVSRSYNTNVQRYDDNDEDDRYDRRSDRAVSGRRDGVPSFLSGKVFDPFSPTRSVSQLLNMMDQMAEVPVFAVPRSAAGGPRRSWDVKEDGEGLYLRMDMPGLAKENVKVSVEQNTLTIKGEAEKEGEEEDARRYSSRIDLPPNLYKTDSIRAEMKNGVLKVAVPKVKEDDRKDVVQVKVD